MCFRMLRLPPGHFKRGWLLISGSVFHSSAHPIEPAVSKSRYGFSIENPPRQYITRTSACIQSGEYGSLAGWRTAMKDGAIMLLSFVARVAQSAFKRPPACYPTQLRLALMHNPMVRQPTPHERRIMPSKAFLIWPSVSFFGSSWSSSTLKKCT